MPDSGTDAAQPELVRLEPVTTAVIRGVVPVTGLRDFFDSSFRTLVTTLAGQQVGIRGAAFGLYHGIPGDTFDLEVGFPTDRAVGPDGSVVAGSIPGGRAARLTHAGSFDGLADAWQRLITWIQANGHTPLEPHWEVYRTQPTPDMDPGDLRTDLYWLVAD